MAHKASGNESDNIQSSNTYTMLPTAKPTPPSAKPAVAAVVHPNAPPPPAKPAPPQKPSKNKAANLVPIEMAIDASLNSSGTGADDSSVNSSSVNTAPSDKVIVNSPLLKTSAVRSQEAAVETTTAETSVAAPASPSPLLGGGRRSPTPSDRSIASASVSSSKQRTQGKAINMRSLNSAPAVASHSVNGSSYEDDDCESRASSKASILPNAFTATTSDQSSKSQQQQQQVVGVVVPASGQYTNGKLAVGEPSNEIYHLAHYSELWVLLTLMIHIGQFALLLTVGYSALPGAAFGLMVVLVLAVPALLVASRLLVKKNHMSSSKNIKLRGNVCTPADEADDVPDAAVYCIAAAAILEGVAFAVYSAVTSGNSAHLSSTGFYTKGTLLQTLRFVSITLLALNRTLRPANRLDPLRTILELELVAVCWDALDGSTLYELLDYEDLSSATQVSVRFLMAFWYTSVGFRMALMFATNLSPLNPIKRFFIASPFQLAPQPTVDRTLQGLRVRSLVTIAMAVADLYAAILRLVLWIQGRLDPLQQDMCLKNFLFLFTVGFAVNNYFNTLKREWNKRELPLGFRRPSRDSQLKWLRWGFAASYLTVSALFTAILVRVTAAGVKWVGNFILDAFFVTLFFFYCWNAHIHQPRLEPTTILLPKKGFFEFPGRMAISFSVLLLGSLLLGRIPAIYYHYSSLSPGSSSGDDDSSGSLYTYDSAVLVVILSIVPIAALGNFWTIAFMLFRREFTASPGNYNAIHDPSIKLVALSTMVEGALDVLSCSTLMQLVENDLPAGVNAAIVLFCLLEMLNACQSFGLQALLSGGHDDTQLDLVRWNALLRCSRGAIDFGTIVLRLVLWIKYNAVSSVFLVKNLYNLIHTFSQVERYQGTSYYPKGTLFSEFVPPQDWYGMSKEKWRDATRDTVVAQARAGRGV